MKRLFPTFPLLLFPIMTILAQTSEPEDTLKVYASVLKAFKSPPAEYRSAPLWVWNDQVTRQQIEDHLMDLKGHGIGGVFIHPRPGLITPYLSDEWFSLCRYAVDTGKKLGMKVWLYDENSYPSGFAGGHVPAQMPEAGRRGLRMTHLTELPPQFSSEPILVLAKDSSGYNNITQDYKTRTYGSGDYFLFTLVKQKPSPWYGGFSYVDIMRREVTEKFIDVTMNAYKRVIGDEFGRVVPGVFQDEAEINPASEPGAVVVNYTPALFDRFQSRWGYDLKTHLPSLYEDVGKYRRVRHNFYATLLDLLIDNWAKPYYDYCTSNNLIFTGHYWEHEWPRPVVNPDNLACAAYAHMPGIDILMNDFQMDSHAQFGNARSVKEIRSAANQLGRRRTLSETFGASGWDMTFFDQKRIADWEYALGVNFLNQHLAYLTIKGARKRDHPLSFSYHEPWWRYYRTLADYYGRLSVALCSGEQLNKVLVLEPTTTGWMYATPQRQNERLEVLGKSFQDFINALEAGQVEYDLTSEDILLHHGQSQDRQLLVGKRAYSLVVLPPGLDNLNEATLMLLRSHLSTGGTLVCFGKPPRYIDGKESDLAQSLSTAATWIRAKEEDARGEIQRLCPPALTFHLSTGPTRNLLFHHRRSLKDCELLFLANTDGVENQSGEIQAFGQSCEQWDLFTGASAHYPFTVKEGKLSVAFTLPPGGSLLLCFRPVARAGTSQTPLRWTDVSSQGPSLIERREPNLLTLDYCDLTLDGKTDKDLYFYQAQLKTYQHHGLERNPWDNGVQYKTAIVDRDTFALKSGFEAAFHISIADGVTRESLRVVVERPGLFHVTVNGQVVKPRRGEWWLDKSFGVFDIGRNVQYGQNTIAVKASPFTIHSELEPVYILGDFSLAPREKGFEIRPSGAIQTGPWNEQGMPFYAGGVSYTKEFAWRGSKWRQCVVALGRWSGVVAGVTVNGREAGSIAFAPYELDVSRLLRYGKNEITVTVYGSLKNSLGPHHNNPSLGRAWPSQFQQGAKEGYPRGAAYSTVGYGLFDDFILRNVGD
jgi:hypothetical protein